MHVIVGVGEGGGGGEQSVLHLIYSIECLFSPYRVYTESVCSIGVEMSSAAAAAAAANFLFSPSLALQQFLCVVFGTFYVERWRKVVSSKHSMHLMYNDDDDDDEWYTSRVNVHCGL